MKRILLALVLVLATSGSAQAFWTLFDDFGSGSLDPAKWSKIGNGTGTAQVQFGICWFSVNASDAAGQNMVMILQNGAWPVTGVKATMDVHSSTGPIKAGVVSPYGYYNQRHGEAFTFIDGEANRTGMSVGFSNGTAGASYEAFSAYFRNDYNVVGSDYDLTARTTGSVAVGTATNDGELRFSPTYMQAPTAFAPRIGVSNGLTGSETTVSMREVYVMYGYNYAIPYAFYGSGGWTGIAISSILNSGQNNVEIYYRANNGTLLATQKMDMFWFDQNSTVAPAQSTDAGWVHIRSTEPLYGLALVGGTNQPLYDMDMTGELYTDLVCPHLDTTSGQWKSTLMLANPNEKANDVEITYYDKSGAEAAPFNATMPAMGSVQVDLGTQLGEVSGGTLVLRGNLPLTGFLLYDGTQSGNGWKAGLSLRQYHLR